MDSNRKSYFDWEGIKKASASAGISADVRPMVWFFCAECKEIHCNYNDPRFDECFEKLRPQGITPKE